MKKTIKDLNLKGKKVLIRVDFNVPIKNGVITSNKRILAALPTINYAIEAGAKVILLSHLGRVKTQEDKKGKSLKIVAEELGKQLRQRVIFVPETRGSLLENKIKEMLPQEVLMIENTRFEDLNNSAESKNSKELGKYWAGLGDVFINDAFGTSHRSHASNVGIAENISESAIGFLIQEELSMLAKAVYGNKKPFIAIIGGAKITDKIKVINNLIDKVDYLIIGGGMAYTFCAAQGLSIGSSLVEVDKIALAREYMKKYSDKIILPIDSAVSINFSNSTPLYNNSNSLEIPEGYMGLDIGPKSINLFKTILSGAKTVLWNGPMGVAEFDNYKMGTESIANIIAAQPGVFSIIGGGDSAAAIINLGLEKKFSHISTGGGASLQFLEGDILPGIESIQESNKRNLENNEANNNLKVASPITSSQTATKPINPQPNKTHTSSQTATNELEDKPKKKIFSFGFKDRTTQTIIPSQNTSETIIGSSESKSKLVTNTKTIPITSSSKVEPKKDILNMSKNIDISTPAAMNEKPIQLDKEIPISTKPIEVTKNPNSTQSRKINPDATQSIRTNSSSKISNEKLDK